MSSPLRLDLHVHSRHSPDGTMSPEELVGALRSTGLGGFALTDHNTMAGHSELREIGGRRPDLLLVPGVEVSTQEGHLLVYGIRALPPVHRPLADTLAWVEGEGGVAVLAHPFRWTHGVGRRISETAPVPALETVNGHNSPRANRAAEGVAVHRAIGATGGSDAHVRGDLGRSFTEFPENVRSMDDILDALRRGRTKAGGLGSGPLQRARGGVRSGLLRIARGLRPI
jgi:predicted metal-dependent phosphoesterase TrpH